MRLFRRKQEPIPENKKRAVLKALEMMQRPEMAEFITIDNPVDKKGVTPRVTFTIQSDPVGEVGVNGCQAEDIIEYARNLIIVLNNIFSCSENKQTIQHLNGALQWQINRRNDRKYREVEGKAVE